MEAIHLHNLCTGYKTKNGEIAITRDINADLLTGQLTCLLGSNGAGKSTLMRTLSAFQPPLKGDISIMGKPIADYAPKELSWSISVVLTEKLMLRNMSAEELIALGRSPYTGFWGNLTAEDHRIVDQAIEAVGIDSLRHRMVNTLSDGERQKAMIAKALAQETPIIILDEPTAFIDFPGKVEIMELLARLAHEQDKAIFLSTHDLELALLKADQIWLLHRNQPLATGTPEQVASDGSLAACFPSLPALFAQISELPKVASIAH